ncbi:MAG: biotin--[acetyl-CoA-carboxylase] ligase [Pelolinea sp.]|nr:biotin--[acetyl-CoA-carboxylase] ligase [Pelolinea sp.]
MNKEMLEYALDHLPIPSFRFFEETDSTNTQALNWVSQGAPEYSLVIAEKQTAGRGRSGRSWVTTPRSSLAVSIILHPTKFEIGKLGLFSLLGGFSVLKMIEDSYQVNAQVKWPNDVLIENKKTAGILSEALWQGETLQGIVLGIGINLLTPSVPPPDGLLFPATCIQAHCDREIDQIETLACLLETIIKLRESMLLPTFINHYEEKLAYMDQIISLDTGEANIISGHLVGVDEYGNVRIRFADGNEKIFPIGDIKLRPL